MAESTNHRGTQGPADDVERGPSAAEALIALADALDLQLDELIAHVEELRRSRRRVESLHSVDVRLRRRRPNASSRESVTSGSSRP